MENLYLDIFWDFIVASVSPCHSIFQHLVQVGLHLRVRVYQSRVAENLNTQTCLTALSSEPNLIFTWLLIIPIPVGWLTQCMGLNFMWFLKTGNHLKSIQINVLESFDFILTKHLHTWTGWDTNTVHITNKWFKTMGYFCTLTVHSDLWTG